MSVVILGMKMPNNCDECPCYYETEGAWRNECEVLGKEYIASDDRPEWCPLVELPPHGRLIDGDVAEVIVTDEKDEVGGFLDGILYAADWIANQPTIIEAEEVSE